MAMRVGPFSLTILILDVWTISPMLFLLWFLVNEVEDDMTFFFELLDPGMLHGQGCRFLTQHQDQIILIDSANHVPVQKIADPAEHFLGDSIVPSRNDFNHPSVERFAVSHVKIPYILFRGLVKGDLMDLANSQEATTARAFLRWFYR
jgi:hypothetical protein